MTSLHKKQQGFTIVELLIVIVVIGILAALVITTFNGIQQKGRDTERQTDIKALHGQLEAYFAQNGRYPTLANMNDRAAGGFVETSLKGIDAGAFVDPKNKTSDKDLKATATANFYTYTVAPADCDNENGNDCISYVLSSDLEGTIDGSATYVKNSLNN